MDIERGFLSDDARGLHLGNLLETPERNVLTHYIYFFKSMVRSLVVDVQNSVVKSGDIWKVKKYQSGEAFLVACYQDW